MFNTYWKNTDNSKVEFKAPSSISGTLVKTHSDSVIIAVKIGSDEFNSIFNCNRQAVLKEGTFDWTKDKYNIVVIQTMLANDGWIFVEYVETGEN